MFGSEINYLKIDSQTHYLPYILIPNTTVKLQLRTHGDLKKCFVINQHLVP